MAVRTVIPQFLRAANAYWKASQEKRQVQLRKENHGLRAENCNCI